MLFLTLGNRENTPIYQKITCISNGVFRKISTYARATLETSQLLESLKRDREVLDNQLKELQNQENTENVEAMIAKFSPLDIWNTVAGKLEKLAERLDKN